MSFSETLQAYMEVGFLGLCAILIIIMFYLIVKRSHDKEDERDKQSDTLVTTMQTLMNNQVKSLVEQMQENNKILLNSVLNGINNHVPSPEENNKLTNVSREINNNLQQILLNTSASRASLVQYHNGGRGVNKQSFLKMSMTNEQVQLGVKPLITDFKDQFRNLLAYFVQQLEETGVCYIEDRDTLKHVDISTYEFLKDRGIQAKFGIALKDESGMVIGFLSVEYINKQNVDITIIDKVLKGQRRVFETLLSL